MKNKKIAGLISLILIMVSLMTSVVWAGVSGFEVQDGAGNSAGDGTGSSGWFALNGSGVETRSGTRYAIRVQNENGEYKDIGGDYYDLFWLNHTYKDIQANNYINDTGKAAEAMWSGTTYYYNNSAVKDDYGVGAKSTNFIMRGLYRLQNGGKVFDTYASSLSTYTKSAENSNGETVDQARHVLTWLLNTKRQNGKNKNLNIHTDGFGLNDDDIIKLINFEERVANFWRDDKNKGSNDGIRAACETVLEQIEQIRAGKLDIQIRAEILMRVRPDEDCKTKNVHDVDVSASLRRIKENGSSYYYFLTFRECLALAKLTGTTVTKPMIECATLLRETNEPWRSEEKYVEAAKVYGSNYWLGWDYIQFENPYQLDQTTVTETAKLKNADGSETILSGPTETKITEDTTFTRPENNYTYTGLEFDGGTKSSVTSQLVEADNGTHTIVYWYDVEKKTTITINYKDEKTGKDICPSEMVEPGEHSKKYFIGYEYTGLEIVKPNPEEKDSNKTSVTITDDKETHEITFWYKMQTQVKIMGRCEGMSKPIYTEYVGTLDLPLYKTFKEKDYTPSKAYKFLDEYEVKEGTFAWTSKGSTETGNSVTLNLDEVTTTPQQILIVFYYESKYTLTVNHRYVDPITGDEKVEKTFSNLQIIPGEEKSLSSISMSNYLNLKYEPSSEVTADGFTKYSKSQNNVYTLKFTPSEKNYTINFYYTSQTITVKHIQNNEVEKKKLKY